MLEHLCLVRLRDVAMPVPRVCCPQHKRSSDTGTGRCRRSRRANIAETQPTEAGGSLKLCPRMGKNARSLGLARSSGSREQDVLVGVEDGICGGNLQLADSASRVVVDEGALDERRVAVESVHGGLDVELGKLVLRGWSLPASGAANDAVSCSAGTFTGDVNCSLPSSCSNRNAGVL